MRSSLSSALRYLAPLVLLPTAAGIAYAPSLGCSSSDSAPAPSADAGADAAPDADTGDDDDDDAGPNEAAVVCSLSSGDPVALCTQKIVLSAWKAGARLTTGVAAAWSATTGLPVAADGGALVHDLHADVAYGAAIANYHLASFCYGDQTLIGVLDADLYALQPTILADFAVLPAEYTGDTYFHLRSVAGGLRDQNYVPEGDSVDVIAEAYGAAISSAFFNDLGPSPILGDAGAGDAGDAGDAGATSDGGDAGVLPPLDNGVLGARSGSSVTYTTVDAATGALALLDLASRHTGDNPTQAAKWEAEAVQTFDHLYTYARSSSGFYYAGATTGSDAGIGDTPTDVLGANGYTFSTNVEGRVAEILFQAASAAAANTLLTRAGAYPFVTHAEELFAALQGTPSLYDAVNTGFFASITPSSGGIDNTKPTIGNAALFAGLADLAKTGSTATAGMRQVAMAGIIASTRPNLGFLGLQAGQKAYLPLATATFDAVAASDANYTSRDTSAALDALARQLPASCGQ